MTKATKRLVKLRETARNRHANRYLKRQLGPLYGKNAATLTLEQVKLARILLMDAADHSPLDAGVREQMRALRRRL